MKAHGGSAKNRKQNRSQETAGLAKGQANYKPIRCTIYDDDEYHECCIPFSLHENANEAYPQSVDCCMSITGLRIRDKDLDMQIKGRASQGSQSSFESSLSLTASLLPPHTQKTQRYTHGKPHCTHLHVCSDHITKGGEEHGWDE